MVREIGLMNLRGARLGWVYDNIQLAQQNNPEIKKDHARENSGYCFSEVRWRFGASRREALPQRGETQ